MPAEELNLGLLLFIPYRAMEQAAYQAVVDAGHTDITPAQAKLLARVCDDGVRLTDLAESAQVTKQTAAHLVDNLERAGYLHRTPDPTDARARLLHLTPKAKSVRPIADAAVHALEQSWQSHLGPTHYQSLRTSLTLLRQITDPYL
ncbi:hypothetical protein GCM10027589_18260 [Actinocorallia lasiicapitis]